MRPRIVLDTNVLVSALRSRNGASFKLLELVGSELFDIVLSVPLVEYEAAAKRHARQVGLTYEDIDDILDYLCAAGVAREIFFLWRPFLKDPKDDLVLEVAVESESDFLVTHNVNDFVGAERFGIQVITPRRFLETIGKLSWAR